MIHWTKISESIDHIWHGVEYGLGAMLVALTIYALSHMVGCNHTPPDTIASTEHVYRDTVRVVDTVVVHRDVVRVVSAPAHWRARGPVIVYVDSSVGHRDTLISQQIEAAHDTVIDRDSIHMTFTAPPPLFGLEIRRVPDTVYATTRAITTTHDITHDVYRPPAWYEEAGKILLGVLVGYGAGRLSGGM